MSRQIVILGAGPGISMGVARHFGKQGFAVGLLARSAGKLQQMRNQLEMEGIPCATAAGSVSDPHSLSLGMETLIAGGPLPKMVLFNAAAVDVKDLLDQDWLLFQRTLETNLGGAFHLIKYMLPKYLEQGSGKLFFTGGGFALSGDPQWTTLSVGKAALRNLVQAAAKKAAGTGVHVAQLTVCGYVNASDPKYNPASIAQKYWELYEQEAGSTLEEIIY
ncbi:MAG: SDR family NAD(P)-dependent oxidoreductase [Bacteroidetes bacterium]|jgi:short-subunit dehydrogenase|nr:SDR family NAD(P)-dependent oxidoreductase [Bacteroidota bacterium]